MQMTFSKQKRGKAQSSNPRSSNNHVSFSILLALLKNNHILDLISSRANNHIMSGGSSSLCPASRHASQSKAPPFKINGSDASRSGTPSNENPFHAPSPGTESSQHSIPQDSDKRIWVEPDDAT